MMNALAFPGDPPGQTGMSLRDYFAGQALAFWARMQIGGWSGDMPQEMADNVARHAYIMADAMLRARDAGE